MIHIPSKYELLHKHSKEELAEMNLSLLAELNDVATGMLSKMDIKERYNVSLGTINLYMKLGKLKYHKVFPDKPNSAVRFNLSDVIECFGKKNG